MRIKKIPTIFGLFTLVAGIVFGVFLIGQKQYFRLGASPQTLPKDIRISDISDTSFTVSWVTDKEVVGFVKWGVAPNSQDTSQVDEELGQNFTHRISLKNLNPQTQYYFKINSGGTDFDNSGIPWQIKTGAVVSPNNKAEIVSGTVLNTSGSPVGNALVYLSVGGGSLLSTTTSQTGAWVIPINFARIQDLTSFVDIDATTTLIEITVNAAGGNVASASVYPQSAKPVPPIILGQTNDFKNLAPSANSENPTTSVEVPEASPASGFTVTETAELPPSKMVTLESINNGEIVSSTKPEFFGKGPAGTSIEITVQSENPQTQTAKIAPNGSWKWSPKETLSEGVHTVTITWKDASSGIARSLTKSFVVQASQMPAFTSTPSATPKTTPKPTKTPTPTPTPRSTISPTPTTVIETIYPTSIPSSAPTATESGTFAPTLALLILGLGGVFVLGAFTVGKQEV